MTQVVSPPIPIEIMVFRNRPPVWNAGMRFDVTSGTAKRWDISQMVSDPDGDPLTLGVHIMPQELIEHGFSFDTETKELIYDGTPWVIPEGEPWPTYELTLWASDGRTD